MDDVEWLKSRLRAALLLPLLAAACTETHPAGYGGPCAVSRNWCADADAATRARVGAATELDCPTAVRGNEEEARRAWDDGGTYQGPPTHLAAALSTELTSERRSQGEGQACCYEWKDSCPGGRPLLEADGRARVAAVARGREWLGAEPRVDVPSDRRVRRALARAWLRDARLEHASIASFARAALELLALGAPPELVRGCQLAALDEIRHAEICFAIASRHARRAMRPGPLAPPALRAADFARLAHDTFVEGCFGETVAALAVSRAAIAARDGDLGTLLEGIASDEAAHAALAWSTLRWALSRAPGAVAESVARATAELSPGLVGSAVAEPALDLSAYGQLDGAGLARVRSDAWYGIIEPLLAELGIGGIA